MTGYLLPGANSTVTTENKRKGASKEPVTEMLDVESVIHGFVLRPLSSATWHKTYNNTIGEDIGLWSNRGEHFHFTLDSLLNEKEAESWGA